MLPKIRGMIPFDDAPGFVVLNMTTGETRSAFPDTLEAAVERAEREKRKNPRCRFVILAPVTELNADAAVAYSRGKREAEEQARAEILRAEAFGERRCDENERLRQERIHLRGLLRYLLRSHLDAIDPPTRESDEIPF